MSQMIVKYGMSNASRKTMHKPEPEKFDNYARTILRCLHKLSEESPNKKILPKEVLAWVFEILETGDEVTVALYGTYMGKVNNKENRSIIYHVSINKDMFPTISKLHQVSVEEDALRCMWCVAYKIIELLNDVGLEPSSILFRIENNADYDDVKVSILA